MLTAKIHPLDFSELKKGDTIAAEVLEEITGAKRDDKYFSLKILAIKEQIEKAREEMGQPVKVRSLNGDSLIILTDEQAAGHLNNRANGRWRGAAKDVKQLGQVDMRNLNETQRKDHERNILIQGQTLAGSIIGRRRALRALPHVRKTPLLFDKKEDENKTILGGEK